ncbi:hypothetical protein CEXT_453181 [Caerostris extrusa]|uniref:Uncharacterized protein n=1 Tax=Caerostris extrusa TaxID=172846 RepID=A0AAV4SKX4_CAEEX|nr:hypothetical protein CEXT_453181 [Caerostris extrusa]
MSDFEHYYAALEISPPGGLSVTTASYLSGEKLGKVPPDRTCKKRNVYTLLTMSATRPSEMGITPSMIREAFWQNFELGSSFSLMALRKRLPDEELRRALITFNALSVFIGSHLIKRNNFLIMNRNGKKAIGIQFSVWTLGILVQP